MLAIGFKISKELLANPGTGVLSLSLSLKAASANDCAEACKMQLLSVIIANYKIVNIIKSRVHMIISP